MQEYRIPLNGLELQVREYPHPCQPVLFLHFSSANLLMWSAALPFFQDRCRLLLVDLPGHGRSSRPDAGYHMDALAADVAGILSALDLPPAHVIGSSLGAEVGLALAANHPEKVRSLVLDGALSSEFGPYSTFDGTPDDFEAFVREQLAGLQAAPQQTFPTVEALLGNRREVLTKYNCWNSHVEAMYRYGAYEVAPGQYIPGLHRAALLDYLGHYFRYQLEAYYPQVQCPLLMLPGQGDQDDPAEMAVIEKLAALAPQAEVFNLPGWDHPYGWLIDPAPVCAAVLDFLDRAAG
jgi:2-succinyl-6-hydroxy-2,4-cyclohexadiene-1-carboxylate synthase